MHVFREPIVEFRDSGDDEIASTKALLGVLVDMECSCLQRVWERRRFHLRDQAGEGMNVNAHHINASKATFNKGRLKSYTNRDNNEPVNFRISCPSTRRYSP